MKIYKVLLIGLILYGCSSPTYKEEKSKSVPVGNKYVRDSTQVLGAYSGQVDTAAVNRQKEEKLRNDNEQKEKVIAALAWLEPMAFELQDYYYSKMKGKTFNKIADMFYDEGFSREFDTKNGIFITTYAKRVYDEGDNMIYLWFDVWHSYGYGKLEGSSAFNIKAEGETFNYW